MSNERTFRTTNCPACGAGFKYPYHTGQTLYRISCRKAACGTTFVVDIADCLHEKVTLLRGETQTVMVLELPDQLTGTLEQ